MDMAERHGTNMSPVFLDLQKAFDKVHQQRLIEVLQCLRVPLNILQTRSSMSKKRSFELLKAKTNLNTKAQKSGIRQGCPLSPYLFCVLLSAVFQDIKCELTRQTRKNLYTLK